MGIEIYLDNNSTTKIDPDVSKEMLPYLKDLYGNVSCSHDLGIRSWVAIQQSRSIIADYLLCNLSDIIFTSCATESNNGIIKHFVYNYKTPHIISSMIEHPSILKTLEFYYNMGMCTYDLLSVNEYGIINLSEFDHKINSNTKLCSIMLVNNETGVYQDIVGLKEKCNKNGILLHTDATQALGKVNINSKDFDFISLSSHKIHGPKGCGLLYSKIDITPIIHGGGQERGLRAGTESVHNIVGFGKAIELLKNNHNKYKLMYNLTTYLVDSLSDLNKKYQNNIIEINSYYGTPIYNNVVNFSLMLDVNIEDILEFFNDRHIYISSGSACHSSKPEPSYVLKNMGISGRRLHNCIRVSLSRNTTINEINVFLKYLNVFIERNLKV